MKVVVDEKIPYIKGILEKYARVEYLPGSRISKKELSDADALVIRTRTRCDESLLQGTPLKFIGTATIGTDHIDLDWCRNNNIEVASAPGCNSGSVMQYVAASLSHLSLSKGVRLEGLAIGIVGVGNVGSKVAAMAEAMGLKVMLNDPPRERNERSSSFVSLGEITGKADIISFHVPLTTEGRDRTEGLAGVELLDGIRQGCIIINTSRGPVLDERALADSLGRGHAGGAVIDVWRNEPHIDPELLRLADISTPHIAGYSQDGKRNGTMMIVRRLAEFFGLPLKEWEPEYTGKQELTEIGGEILYGTREEQLARAILKTYPIIEDSNRLKVSPESFEALRGEYWPRREFSSFRIGEGTEYADALRKLGFR